MNIRYFIFNTEWCGWGVCKLVCILTIVRHIGYHDTSNCRSPHARKVVSHHRSDSAFYWFLQESEPEPADCPVQCSPSLSSELSGHKPRDGGDSTTKFHPDKPSAGRGHWEYFPSQVSCPDHWHCADNVYVGGTTPSLPSWPRLSCVSLL